MRRVIVSFAVAACWVLCSLAPAAAEDSLPQNGKIAFAGSAPEDCGPGCESSSENWDIYTVNADGSDLVKITNDPSAEMDPAWSPDGTRIAYTRDSKDGDAIYVMNADGTG